MRKRLKRVTALILALTLIITAVKVSSSVFADSDTGIFYASDFVNDPYGGYLNVTFEYGEYPQTKVTDDTLIASLNGETPDSNSDVTYNSIKYRKVEKGSPAVVSYYKYEPIEWRILSIDETNKEVFVLSEKVLDSHEWDNQTSPMYTWDGKNYNDSASLVGTHIPTLRTWLNDDTIGVNSFINTAFPNGEQANIIPKEYEAYNDEFFEAYFEAYDGTKTEDKITLLSDLEAFVAHDGQDMAIKYGFDSNYQKEDGFYKPGEIYTYTEETNRVGILTDYSSTKYYSQSSTVKKDGSVNYGKKSAYWWTKSNCKESTGALVVDDTGFVRNCINHTQDCGVRPALTLKFSSLKELDVDMNYGLRGSYTFEGYSLNGGDHKQNVNDLGTTLTLGNVKNLKAYFTNEKTIDTDNKTLTTWYAKGLADDKNHGYINLGSYPKTKVRDNYLISKLEEAYNDTSVTKDSNGYFTYGYNKYKRVEEGTAPDIKVSFYQVESITWQVLKFNDDGTALLLSKDVIDAKKFNETASTNKWDDASTPPSLRTWLNGDFYSSAFNDNEKLLIKEYAYEIYHENDGAYDKNDGDIETVTDKITLLSNYETSDIKAHGIGIASDYDRIGMSSGRIGHGTDYALDHIEKPIGSSMTYSGNSVNWWTRSRYGATTAYYVTKDGKATYYTSPNLNYGVRPCLTLDLSSLDVEGDGSIENPYSKVGYKVNVQSTGGGRVTPCNDYFASGTSITLTATPNEGFKFDGWYEGDSKLPSDLTYNFNVSSDRNIEARFKTANNKTITNFTKGNGYVNFGSFPQTEIDDITGLDPSEYMGFGDNYYLVEPITWEVLDVENTSDGKTNLLLFSNKIIYSQGPSSGEALPYSEMKTGLNNVIYGIAFNDKEKDKIATSTVEAYDVVANGTDTEDKVFLLSAGDLTGVMNIGEKYGFAPEAWTTGDESNRTSKITDFAKSFYGPSLTHGPEDTYAYWLRDYDDDDCFYVNELGQTHYYYEDRTLNYDWSDLLGVSIKGVSLGIRPAIRVTIDNSNMINGGDGTISSPYTLGQFKVTFDPNGGSGTMYDVYLNCGESFTIPDCTFTKTDYTFDYWTIEGVKVTTSSITITSDVTLKANWKSNSSGGGGSSGGGSSGGGSSSTEIKVNFNFNTGNKDEDKKLLDGNKDEIKKFKTDGGKVTSLPENLKRDGYKFEGLFLDEECKTPLKIGDKIKNGTDVFVKWSKIEDLKNKPFIIGYEDGTFKPNSLITRAEVATILSRISEDFSEDENYKEFKNVYPDLVKSDWYDNYIGYVTKSKVMTGYEDGTFIPKENMTRAEFSTAVVRRFNLTKNEKSDRSIITFTDHLRAWYKENVMTLASYGYIHGYEDGTFRGDTPITRAEAVKILNSVTGRSTSEITKEDKEKVLAMFSDIKETDWFFPDVVISTLGN